MGAPVPASPELVAAALASSGEGIRRELILALASKDKPTAERAARTLKKISEADRAILHPLRKLLLKAAFDAQDIRVQWNLSIVLGRLPLTGRDKAVVVDLMFERLRDPSGLNRTLAMQALMDLSEADPALRVRIVPIVREALEHGTPAMRARAKRLLKPPASNQR
jgi:hypothetical protein